MKHLLLILMTLTNIVYAENISVGDYAYRQGTSWGILKIYNEHGKEKFSIKTLGERAHTCELDGDVLRKSGKLIVDKKCTISANGANGVLVLEENDGCRQYCGVNGHFSGLYMKENKDCDDKIKELADGRKDFEKLYDSKQYLDAYVALRPEWECQVSWMNEVQRDNNLAFAMHRIGGTNGNKECINTLRELIEAAPTLENLVPMMKDTLARSRALYQLCIQESKVDTLKE